jgi:hypothetical protein
MSGREKCGGRVASRVLTPVGADVPRLRGKGNQYAVYKVWVARSS